MRRRVLAAFLAVLQFTVAALTVNHVHCAPAAEGEQSHPPLSRPNHGHIHFLLFDDHHHEGENGPDSLPPPHHDDDNAVYGPGAFTFAAVVAPVTVASFVARSIEHAQPVIAAGAALGLSTDAILPGPEPPSPGGDCAPRPLYLSNLHLVI